MTMDQTTSSSPVEQEEGPDWDWILVAREDGELVIVAKDRAALRRARQSLRAEGVYTDSCRLAGFTIHEVEILRDAGIDPESEMLPTIIEYKKTIDLRVGKARTLSDPDEIASHRERRARDADETKRMLERMGVKNVKPRGEPTGKDRWRV